MPIEYRQSISMVICPRNFTVRATESDKKFDTDYRAGVKEAAVAMKENSKSSTRRLLSGSLTSGRAA